MLALFSEIRLRRDQPDLGLPAGIVGSIVEVFTEPSEGYIVEFNPPYDQDVYDLGPNDLELIGK